MKVSLQEAEGIQCNHFRNYLDFYSAFLFPVILWLKVSRVRDLCMLKCCYFHQHYGRHLEKNCKLAHQGKPIDTTLSLSCKGISNIV